MKRMPKVSLLTASLGLSFLSQAQGAVTYSYWEGPGVANTIAIDNARSDLWWANQFFRQPGGEAISSITVALGPKIAAGRAMSFMVYDDPNGDGLPDDLVWLAQVDGNAPAFAPPPGSVNSLFTVTFPTPVNVGASFFVGALLLDAAIVPCTVGETGPTCYEDIRSEITNSAGRSWFAANEVNRGTFDPQNPNGAEFGPAAINSLVPPQFAMDFILFADGLPGDGLTQVPEPGTTLILFGALALIVRRASGYNRS
jgi:hypothetical protein